MHTHSKHNFFDNFYKDDIYMLTKVMCIKRFSCKRYGPMHNRQGKRNPRQSRNDVRSKVNCILTSQINYFTNVSTCSLFMGATPFLQLGCFQ